MPLAIGAVHELGPTNHFAVSIIFCLQITTCSLRVRDGLLAYFRLWPGWKSLLRVPLAVLSYVDVHAFSFHSCLDEDFGCLLLWLGGSFVMIPMIGLFNSRGRFQNVHFALRVLRDIQELASSTKFSNVE